MAYTHRLLAIECLPVLVVPVLLGRHLVAGLGLALGVLFWGHVLVGFYMAWGPWETANARKDIFIFFQEIFFCRWERVWITTYIKQFEGLRSRFAIALNGDRPIEL